MPESFVQLPPNSTGLKQRTRQRTVGANLVDEPFVIVQPLEVISYKGRAATYRCNGRAATAAQRLLTIFNASGSTVLVDVHKVTVDTAWTTALLAMPPVFRIHRITAVPTGGTALTKVAEDTALSSNASVTLAGDASADGTNSTTALAATTTAGAHMTQEFVPRILTLVGYEAADRVEFMTEEDTNVMLRASEGLALSVDAIAATTSNPATVSYIASVHWTEYTLP